MCRLCGNGNGNNGGKRKIIFKNGFITTEVAPCDDCYEKARMFGIVVCQACGTVSVRSKSAGYKLDYLHSCENCTRKINLSVNFIF